MLCICSCKKKGSKVITVKILKNDTVCMYMYIRPTDIHYTCFMYTYILHMYIVYACRKTVTIARDSELAMYQLVENDDLARND